MNDQPTKILLIEDNPEDARLIQEILAEARNTQFDLEQADRLSTGLAYLAENDVDLVILDLSLPDSRGLDTFVTMQAQAPGVPSIVLTAFDDDLLALQAVKAGAQDYLVKGQFENDSLIRAIRYAIERQRLMVNLKQRTAALLHSETRFHNMVEHNADGIIIIDRNGIICFVNPAAETLFGRRTHELLGEPFGFPIVANETTEIDVIHKGEESAIVEMRVAETLWEGDIAYLASLRDITKHKQVEEQLRLQAAALETAANGVVITDIEGTILWVNPAFTTVTGYSAQEAIGQNPRMLQSEIHDQSFYENLWETILSGEVWQGEITNRRKDGSLFIVDQTITPVRDEYGQIGYFIAIEHDITEHKQVEEQLRHAQKMEAIGQLAGGVAHDFNNLLTVINGNCELILDLLEENNPLRKDIEQIKRAGDRAALLTRQLLAFSRQQMLQPRVLSLNTVVADIENLLQRVIGEDIELVANLASEPGQVEADPGQIEQIIMNLVVNARDAMPQGGQLTIETANVYLDETYARQHADIIPGPYVMLAVSDTGYGMNSETQAHIFEPFFTTKEVGQGTGLGLATIHGIIKQSNGHIWVYSELGRGTTFKIYLPQVSKAAEAVDQNQMLAVATTGAETILLVEDEEMVRSLAYYVLLEHGYTVLEAQHGKEAIQIYQQHQDSIQLLLTDVVMPGGMSGPQLANHLVSDHPDMKVLYMSGYTDQSIINHHILDRNVAFLQKPFTPNDLLHKVREVLDMVAGDENA